MDTDHHCRWTQIYGGKASEPETSRPVKMRFLPNPPAFIYFGTKPACNGWTDIGSQPVPR